MDYVKLYRERRQVALALPDEPYDFGHDPSRLRQILDEPQADPVLEAARREALRWYRLGRIIVAVAVVAAVAGSAVLAIAAFAC